MDWISVKDRLPINGESVLVWNYKKEETYLAEYEDGMFYEYGRPLNVENTTHWMPLPEQPKQ